MAAAGAAGAAAGVADGSVRVPDAGYLAALGGFLERLLGLDKAAAVRVVGIGGVAAVYCAPPLRGSGGSSAPSVGGSSVLGVRTLPLDPQTAAFDRTVAAGRLLDAVARAGVSDAAAAPVDLALPDPLAGGPSWAGLLPPRTGWRPAAPIGVRALAAAVAQGNADFRFAALGRDRAGLDALAEEIWSRDLAPEAGAVPAPVSASAEDTADSGTGDGAEAAADSGAAASAVLHWRAAHAASVLGFLGPAPERSEAVARVAVHTRWIRLDAPYGTVLERQ